MIFDELLQLYYQYLIVGGIPEAVKNYRDNNNINSVKAIQQFIRTAYIGDMARYSHSADSVKIIECFESIPNQLAKENKTTKFMWKYVTPKAKASRYYTAIEWLCASGIVSKCTQITEGVSPLKSFENPKSYKIYNADTGLLANSYDAIPHDIHFSGPKSAWFRGGLTENFVMQQFVSNSIQPYYWGIQSTHEVEFVIRSKTDGVIPIDVKSGKNTRSTSAKAFREKYNSKYIIKISTKNFGEEKNIVNIPLYAACLINED